MDNNGYSIGFVILHYNTMRETADCAESIKKKIDTPNYHIVIVDNASPNGTGRELQDKYESDDRVTVLLTEENLGFAKGNNIGYRYAAEELKSDFICVLNNDTLLVQDNFFEVIKEEYHRSHYGMMGPKILLNGGKVNPVYYHFPGLHFFEEELLIHKKEYWLMKWRLNYIVVPCKLLKNQIYKLLGKKKKSRVEGIQSLSYVDQRKEDVVLHGCCVVFSPSYMEQYEEAFDPRTFLYKEEELVYLRCRKNGLKTVYNPELQIRHLEDVSTNSVSSSRRKKIMFWLKNQIDSLNILIAELKNR